MREALNVSKCAGLVRVFALDRRLIDRVVVDDLVLLFFANQFAQKASFLSSLIRTQWQLLFP